MLLEFYLVYAPDWRSSDRLEYTLAAARLLADTLPDGVTGSISTVPGSYGAWIRESGGEDVMLKNLVRCVHGLRLLEEETGKRIHLGLEPEPDGFLETTPQCVAYWTDHVFRAGVEELKTLSGADAALCEEWLRTYLGVCFDTCHLAIQFEDLATSVNALHREGIRLSKAHISAALDTSSSESGLRRLQEFNESVYLHQVRGLDERGHRMGWPDLAPALNAQDIRNAQRLRVHFHVPLFWRGDEDFGSTAGDISPECIRALDAAGCEHFEVETYTFDVLPDEIREPDLAVMMEQELIWFQSRWEKSLA